MLVIGGSSSGKGIIFVSDNYIVKSILNETGTIDIEEKKVKQSRIRQKLRKIPVVRGFIFQEKWYSLIPELLLFILGLIDLIFFNCLSQFQANLIPWLSIFLSIIVLYFILSFILKCNWLKFHGAEHKAINAYETGNEISIDTINRESRLHPRCGSTYLIILVPILFILFVISKHIVFSYVISKLFAAGIFLTEGKSKNPIIKGIINCCLFVQRSLTQEPSEQELSVAVKGINQLLSLERDENNI
jgi:uncharacterized protein YqhQ